MLEPQVGVLLVGQGPPPEVVVNAKDKQPGKANERQQEDERKQYNELHQYSITCVKPLKLAGQDLERTFYK